MSLPTVSICGYCGRSLGLKSDRRLPPGEHVGKIVVTAAPCKGCPAVGDVSHSDTTRQYRKEDEKKGGP